MGGPSLERTAAIEIDFTEAGAGIKAGSGKISIFNNNGTLVQAFDAADFTTGTARVDDKVVIDSTAKKIFIDPKDDLVAGTTYYVQIDNGAITDLAGNAYTADTAAATADKADLTFTANDTVAPTEDSRTPVNSATDVAVDSNLTITFNEDVKLDATKTIKLYKDGGNGTFEGTAAGTDDTEILISSLQVNDNTVIIDPTNNLDLSTKYFLDVEVGAIEDLAGVDATAITGANWSFTTANTTAPVVTNRSPADDTNNPTTGSGTVLAGDDLVITFNEEVKAGTGNITIKKESDDSIVETISVSDAKVKFEGTKVTIDPSADLEANTGYYVQIDNNAIEDSDSSSVFYAGINDKTTWNFRTATDIVAPKLASSNPLSPADDAMNVPTDTPLKVTFDENVVAGNGKIFIKDANGNIVGESGFNNGTAIAGTGAIGTIAVATNQLTINIKTAVADDFKTSTNYYVEIEEGTVTDIAGNKFAEISGTDAWNFTTASDDGPVVVGDFSPTDNTTNFPIDGNLEIEFNENVAAVTSGSKKISIKSVDGTDIRNIDLTTATSTTPSTGVTEYDVTGVGKVTFNGKKVTIDPANNLSTSKEYYVEIEDGAIQAQSGDNDTFDGITDKTTFNFTTAAAGEPVAVEFTPTDDSQGVALGDDLKITFNEAVREGTGNISIFKADDTLVEAINVNTSKVSSSGNTITINPTADLEANTDYYVQVADGAIVDSNGEAYDGISDKTTFNFSTSLPDTTAPVVTGATSPADNGTDVAVDANISFNLGEDVTPVAGQNIIITPVGGGTPITIAANDATQVSIANGVVTINPTADLMNGQEYTVAVESGAFVDNAGNEFDGTLAADGMFNFTTVAEDTTTPPTTPPTTPTPSPITPVEAGSPIGTVTEGDNVMEVIDLTGAQFAGQTVTASFEVSREADYDNNIYFYTVDAADGNIGGLAPDASGYLQAALNNVVGSAINAEDGANGDMGSFTLQGGDILGIAIVADGTLAEATSDISSVEGVYLSYMGANTDSGTFDHVRYNNGMFEFEDLANGGDADFNDIQVSIDFTV